MFVFFCFENLKYHFFNFLAVSEGPGLFKKVGETPGFHFHLVSSKSELVGPSYDQQIKIFHLKKFTTSDRQTSQIIAMPNKNYLSGSVSVYFCLFLGLPWSDLDETRWK